METRIKPTEHGIDIEVTVLDGKKDQLLEAFQACSEGRCTCPTNEYQKVASLEIIQSDDAIQITITAKDEQQLDTGEIEKCLEHTRQRAAQQ